MKKEMNAREKEVMKLLWDSNEELTSNEMLDIFGSEKWNKLSVSRTLNSLEKKGLLKITGFKQYNTQYARKFTYAMTKEEYNAKLLIEDGMDVKSFADFTCAFIGDKVLSDKEKAELVKSLEAIIEKLKN
ncbi:MAG: BlaI/MecI/CopY family transcriptional regulator [Lachnospiraceae bacterium]|nr:BlaI/MecI/CopY family transcriptional regulator [Lachnospiraceae bacterium]